MPGKFFGGVHPAQYKSDSSESEIRSPRSPELLVIPMSMHVGAQCRPLVKKGDSVELGQLIGDSDAAVSAPIHSSVSGTVIAVENRPHPGGSGVLSVVIANDFKDTPWRVTEPRADISDLSPEDIADIIRSAGIVGLGGAAFPTHIKVRSGLGKVDTVIINGAECEPYITSGYRGMVENADDILGGARILKKVYGVESVAIAIEDNKADAIRRLRLLLPSSESHIRIISLKTRYPQGAEKQLIQAITRRQVPAGRLPADVGCAVFNTDTAAAVYRAVYYGEPLTQKVVTVAGSSVAMAGNLRVRIGTPISELFSACGGFKETPRKIVVGGPMMGLAQHDLSAPVIKGTNAVLALSEHECGRTVTERTCIRCGRCIEVCPTRLIPMLMYAYEQKGALDELEKLNVADCIECGSCAYICPGRLHLVQSFKSGKKKLAEKRAKEAAR